MEAYLILGIVSFIVLTILVLRVSNINCDIKQFESIEKAINKKENNETSNTNSSNLPD